MKNYILFLISLTFLLTDIHAQIKVLPTDTEGYFFIEELDAIYSKKDAFFVDKQQADAFSKKLSNLLDIAPFNWMSEVPVQLNYSFFVNENGKVEKIKPNSNFPHSRIMLNPQEATEKIIEYLNGVQFKIGKKDGDVVKYIYPFEYSFKTKKVIRAKKDYGENIDGDEYFSSPEKLPEQINMPKPTYPQIARLAGIEGKVFIKAYVDEKGNVQKVAVAQGIGQNCGIDEAACDVVKQTKFSPGTINGKPVKTQVMVPVIFELEKK